MSVEDKAEELLQILEGQQAPTIAHPALESGVAFQNKAKVTTTFFLPIVGKGKAVIAMGADNTTKVALGTVEHTAADKDVVPVRVPPGWFLKVTLTEAALGEVTSSTA